MRTLISAAIIVMMFGTSAFATGGGCDPEPTPTPAPEPTPTPIVNPDDRDPAAPPKCLGASAENKIIGLTTSATALSAAYDWGMNHDKWVLVWVVNDQVAAINFPDVAAPARASLWKMTHAPVDDRVCVKPQF